MEIIIWKVRNKKQPTIYTGVFVRMVGCAMIDQSVIIVDVTGLNEDRTELDSKLANKLGTH